MREENLEKKKYYMYILIIGAIWNIIISLLIFLGSFFANPGLNELGLVYYQMFSMVVLLFGIGYYLVGRDLENNHAVISLGVIGKILVFIFMLTYYILGVVDAMSLVIGIIDFIFAILFIEFLVNFKKIQK